MDLSRFDAAVFDMDGILIDSEPLWRQAEVAVLRPLGVPLTEAMCHETTGLRIDEMVGYWHRRYPWSEPSQEAVQGQILETVTEMIVEHGEAMAGVREVLAALRERGMPVAVASSSPRALIDAVVDALGLGEHFAIRCTAIDEAAGKPDPAVYHTAVARLGVAPARCIAFEDSAAGVRAAHAAGLYVVAVPAPGADDPAFALADERLASLAELELGAEAR